MAVGGSGEVLRDWMGGGVYIDDELPMPTLHDLMGASAANMLVDGSNLTKR